MLQLNRDVPAGQQISADDFRTVEIDPWCVPLRAIERSDSCGRLLKVRLIAGTLLAREALQAAPLSPPRRRSSRSRSMAVPSVCERSRLVW